ncbi:hypothetical protein H9X81_10530 [Hydrogenoanaerobacterium saccharovorans]|uniref:Uncharacterized protein n=1 Tax=Hydrogenoanaerobacterium saccharovorans TaxID=474960 RepID=A0ABS2GRE5_9FIRM|nr:hypothetical protein [Hydrogenoanaerobacterium saccharovorans]MBM6924119.1 hypothetical protein [Hydrogenoanaerobacterium saccharovorans]
MSSTTKKSIILIISVAIIASLVGFAAYSLFLHDILPQEGFLSSLLGRSPIRFSMNCCLISVIAVIFCVPSIREIFMGSVNTAASYKDSHGKRGNRI